MTKYQRLKGAKMNWKNRLTNYNFWISIVSAVLLILQAFNIEFDVNYINEIITAVLGLLVVIGIINDPTKSTTKTDSSSTITTSTSNAEKTESTTAEPEKTESTTNETKNAEDTEKVIPIVNKDETLNDDCTDHMEISVEESQQSENSSKNISNTDAGTVTNEQACLAAEQIVEIEKMTLDEPESQEENNSDANINEAIKVEDIVADFNVKEETTQQGENTINTNTCFNIVNN